MIFFNLKIIEFIKKKKKKVRRRKSDVTFFNKKVLKLCEKIY